MPSVSGGRYALGSCGPGFGRGCVDRLRWFRTSASMWATGRDARPLRRSRSTAHRDRRHQREHLHADDLGSLDIGSSVFYRHITATGRGYSLIRTGVTIAPINSLRHVRPMFFWQASGIDMSVNADGVKLRTESLASMLEGGVAFEICPARRAGARRRGSRSRCLAVKIAPCALRNRASQFVRTSAGHCGCPGRPGGVAGHHGGRGGASIKYDERAGSPAFPCRWNCIRSGCADTCRVPGPRRRDRAIRQPRNDRQFVAHGLRAELKTGNLLTDRSSSL